MKNFTALVMGLVFSMLILQPAYANDNHNALMKKSETERLQLWAKYMSEIGKNCKVTEDYFMGFDEDNAAYWSVDCNRSRRNGILIQIPANTKYKTKQFSCKVGESIGVPCFKRIN